MKIFWDVDTQKDFMKEDGALYVPDAEKIIPNLKKITNYAKENQILVLGSVDRHFEDDDELKTFPMHCMNQTEGQQKIDETLIFPYTFIRSKVASFGKYEDYSTDEIQIEIKNYRQILFEKQNVDVFTNRTLLKFLDRLRVSEIILYGVTTEYCVLKAVLGFLGLNIKVLVVDDAIKEIEADAGHIALQTMKRNGATFTTTAKLLKKIKDHTNEFNTME